MTPITESVLICPRCGFAKSETMPTDSCLFFYECTACNAMLRNQGHCSVFCSFGSVKMPADAVMFLASFCRNT